MLELSARTIERAIYPVGFYRTKARVIRGLSRDLLDRFGGGVPDDIEALLTLKGVGRKTANLVVTLGFDKPGICVDTHVHRISNRLGWVKTRTPEETEQALYENTPARWWSNINLYLVTWGQNICRPIYPRCGVCVIRPRCPQIGVTRVAKT
jgi:endonuclease-3